MLLEVGGALSYRGRHYICIAEEKFDRKELAKEDSVSMLLYLKAGDNVKHLDFQCDEFLAGDVITHRGERITLECPGVDLQFIWTSLYIRKENKEDAEHTGFEGDVEQSAGNKVEGTGDRDQGGESARKENPDQTSA